MNDVNRRAHRARGVAALADVEAIESEGLPSDLPASTYEMLQRGAALDPEAPALSFFLRVEEHRRPETWSYRELLGCITQAANAFHALGADKNTVIGLVLPNLPEMHFAIWGGEAAGIVMPINPLLEPGTIAELLDAAGASILVTLAPFPAADLWPKVQKILPRVRSLQHVVLVNLADRVRGPKRIAAKLLQKREVLRQHGLRGALGLRGAAPRGVRVHDFWRLLRREPGDRLRSGRRILAEDRASMFCTGGTTGLPKMAVRHHGNEVANAWSTATMLGSVEAGKNFFCGLPLFHVNGVLVTGLMPFSRGGHVVLGTPQGYRGEGVVKRFWEIVERHRIHFFSGVPTLYASLLQVPAGAHRLDSLEYGICGAAPMPVQVFRDFEERTGLKILEGYGLTEATCVCSVNPPYGERRRGSIGLRIPGQLMKTVVFDEQGRYVRDCADDEIGVLVVSGPNVFDGYASSEHTVASARLFPDLGDGRRWLDTGDLGRRDRDGYFWLTGRKKDLIIRGGHNIDPAVIEGALHRHPAVQLAAAIGRPDAHAGELPVAYVQLKAGEHASEAELAKFLEHEIPERAAMPKAIRIIDAIPLTAIGKIFKPTLRRREIEDALTAALREGGVDLVRLEVIDDAARGLCVRAELREANGAREADAARVLGQYPFPFSFGSGSA